MTIRFQHMNGGTNVSRAEPVQLELPLHIPKRR
jgi:hypothetical protein